MPTSGHQNSDVYSYYAHYAILCIQNEAPYDNEAVLQRASIKVTQIVLFSIYVRSTRVSIIRIFI
jgi:hypothetical protein